MNGSPCHLLAHLISPPHTSPAANSKWVLLASVRISAEVCPVTEARQGATTSTMGSMIYRTGVGHLLFHVLCCSHRNLPPLSRPSSSRYDALDSSHRGCNIATGQATLFMAMALGLDPSSQDASTSYLNNPKQPLADSNTPTPFELLPFSPLPSAILVNTPLFMSSIIYFTCVPLATLLHQWTRWWLRFTQPRDSPHKQARSFVSHDVENFRVSPVVNALPKTLRLSFRVFVVGLFVWLCNVDRTVFRIVVLWSILHVVASCANRRTPLANLGKSCRRVWGTWITFRRFRPDTLSTVRSRAILKFLSSGFGASPRFDNLTTHNNDRPLDGIGKTSEKFAWKQPSKLDVHTLGQTLDALGESGAWEEFFNAITSLFDSDHVNSIEGHILNEFRIKFRGALNGFLDPTFSSTSVPEAIRNSQLITCLNATHAVLGTDEVSQILCDIFNGRWPELLQSVEMAHSLRRWGNSADKRLNHFVRKIVTHVVAGVQERDDQWISLAMAEFGVQDHVLRDNIEHGDSALLSLLIHITRQAFYCGSWTPFTLASFAQFEIRNTRPELQHEFCSLWNEIVREAWRGGADCTTVKILREIRQAFIGLHQGTDAAPTAFSARTNHYNPVLTQPLSYRFCNIAAHRPNWARQDPATNRFTIHHLTRGDSGSLPASTTQIGGSASHSRPPPSKTQRFPDNVGVLSIPSKTNVVHATTQQAEEVNIKGYDT